MSRNGKLCPDLTPGIEAGVDVPASAGSRCFAGPGGPGGGELVSGAGVRESVTIVALAEQVRVARGFVAGVLGPSHLTSVTAR